MLLWQMWISKGSFMLKYIRDKMGLWRTGELVPDSGNRIYFQTTAYVSVCISICPHLSSAYVRKLCECQLCHRSIFET